METSEWLLKHGWEYDGGAHVHQWRDPINKLSWYTLCDAVSIQERRKNKVRRKIIVKMNFDDTEQDIHPLADN